VALPSDDVLVAGLRAGDEETFASDERWLEHELAACREPGALDGGTHIVVAVERLG